MKERRSVVGKGDAWDKKKREEFSMKKKKDKSEEIKEKVNGKKR